MAKKDAHDAALKRGLARLHDAGVDAASASVDALTRRLGEDHDSDLAVAFLLGRVADPGGAVEALLAIEKAAAAKELKREARRALFKLEQKGLSVPRVEEAREKRPAFGGGSDIEGYLSVVDGAGHRLVWLARPHAGGGLQLLQAMVSDRAGLMRAGGTVIKRKELRAQADEIRRDRGLAMARVPWEYADQVVYEAYEKAKVAGAKTGQFASLRAAFNPTKPKELTHPIYDRLSRDAAQGEDWRARSRRLLDEPEFRFWILDEDWMKPFLDRVAEAQQSRLVLNDAQKEERIAAIVRDGAREIFSGDSGAIFKRRMEDAALCLLESGRREPALIAFAVALQLAEGALGFLDIAFLTGLVQKSLAYYLTQAKQKAAEEPSLIVKP